MRIQGQTFTVAEDNISTQYDTEGVTVRLQWLDAETGGLAMFVELSEEDLVRMRNRVVEHKALHRRDQSD